MRRLFAVFIGIGALGLAGWYVVQATWSGNSANDTPSVSQDLAPGSVTDEIRSEPISTPPVADRLPLDLAYSCAGGVHTDDCLDAADTSMRRTKATMTGWTGDSGRTWGEVFDDFGAQVANVERSFADSDCDVAAWRPDLGERCAAWEAHNLALAIRACLQPPDNASWHRFLLEKRGETDLGVIRPAMRGEAYEWLQRAWLLRECGRTWVPVKDRLAGLLGFVADSPWVDAAYGERAALLGDRDAAKYYVFNKIELDVVRVYGHTVIVDFTNDVDVARARQADSSTRAVVEEVAKRNPAVGFDLLGDLEVERVPQLRARRTYAEHFPEDYWIERAERAAAYKLAAMRLQGVQPHLSLEELIARDIDWNTISQLIGEDFYALSYRVDELITGPLEPEDADWWP